MNDKVVKKLIYSGGMGISNLFSPIGPPVKDASLTGYHALSTTPFMWNHPGERYALKEVDLRMAEMSARFWKRFNGPIKMITDRIGYEYLIHSPLAEVYDEILPILDTRCCGIDPTKYWAAAKIQAMSRLPLPCAIIDMDMLVLKPLALSGEKLVCACYETFSNANYPPMSFFNMRPGYTFPPEWNDGVPPLNTGFFYLDDEALRDEYTKEAFRFMLNERETPVYWAICMVMAEQHILSMCAEARGINAKVLWWMEPVHELITHFWGAKARIRDDEETRVYFMGLSDNILRQLRETERVSENRPH